MSSINLSSGKLENLGLGFGGFLDDASRKSQTTTLSNVLKSLSVPAVNSLAVKRALDIVLASLALIALMPVFAVIAFLVKRDGGPVIYRQRRVGKDGVEFWFYKFRSMVVDADKVRVELEKLNQHGQSGVTFKMKNDPRVTPVGRILRKTSLDELPQFFNVLLGDMSLVGPRPALPTEVARYTSEERRRLDVTPGLTCFWQIGGRSELPFEKQVQLDIKYIEERSLWLDLTLLVKTPTALIAGSGAY